MEELLGAMFGGGGGGGFGGGMPPGFMQAMGGGGGSRGSMRRRRGEDVGIRHSVTLEELYTGCDSTVPRERTVICGTCSGSGCKRAGSTTTCRTCRGQGVTAQLREVAPGFVTRAAGPCPGCQGQGSTVADADKCTACKGKRLVEQNAPLAVKILPGMKHGEQLPFVGQGDEDMNTVEPGDIIVVLQCKEHPTFTREGDDLRMKMTVSLAESLCGASVTFRHLDGRSLHVKPQAGRLIEPESCFVLRGEGMPILNRAGQYQTARPSGRKGDLYIDFTVQFPRHLTDESVALLKKVLPPPPPKPPIDEENHEECYASPQPLADVRRMIEKEKASSDDDDDARAAGGPGGGVRCAHA